MSEMTLPEIVTLEDFDGDFNEFNEFVYSIFKEDFVDSKPVYQGVKLGLKRFPLQNGKEATYYHMTHSGMDENNRIPELRRMERISWPRPMIDDSTSSQLKVWRNVRHGQGGTKNRINILHEKEGYLVILDDRGKYILPWTAFIVKGHQLNKRLKEFEDYLKAETASD